MPSPVLTFTVEDFRRSEAPLLVTLPPEAGSLQWRKVFFLDKVFIKGPELSKRQLEQQFLPADTIVTSNAMCFKEMK